MASRSVQLVCQHLEHISGAILERYPSIIRAFAKKRKGVYALYRKSRLYYVGLAQDLRGRLRMHLRDRHAHRWDNFSMYFTIDTAHLKELESLVLRIAVPRGNRQIGNFARSQDLWKELDQRISRHQRDERRRLLGIETLVAKPISATIAGTNARKPTLARYVTRRFPIRWRYKGHLYKAAVRRDARIRFNGNVYTSPSVAASSITKRAMNGWTCWRFQRAPGEWVVLDELRRR